MDIELAQALKEIAELKQQNTNLQEMLKAERSVTCKEEYLKRVTELEETNADLKQSLDWANERESEDIKRITDLEKENAELKDALKGKVCNCMTYLNFKGLESNLTKAKDHIKKLLDCLKQDTNDPQTNYYVRQYMDKAEQFIKDSEVEK